MKIENEGNGFGKRLLLHLARRSAGTLHRALQPEFMSARYPHHIIRKRRNLQEYVQNHNSNSEWQMYTCCPAASLAMSASGYRFQLSLDRAYSKKTTSVVEPGEGKSSQMSATHFGVGLFMSNHTAGMLLAVVEKLQSWLEAATATSHTTCIHVNALC